MGITVSPVRDYESGGGGGGNMHAWYQRKPSDSLSPG